MGVLRELFASAVVSGTRRGDVPLGNPQTPDGTPLATPGLRPPHVPYPGGTAQSVYARGPAVPYYWTGDGESERVIRKRIRRQLEEDYDDDFLDWIDGVRWTGPQNVPIDEIDYSNENDWRAAGDPTKVRKFAKRIEGGRLKPIVLIRKPNNPKYVIVDGHHRALAYRLLGIPVLAYVGVVPARDGPWDSMHASQRKSADPGSTAQSAYARGPTVPYDVAHAPRGGVTVGGKHFTGGQFIPGGDVMARATPDERRAVESGESPAHAPPAAKSAQDEHGRPLAAPKLEPKTPATQPAAAPPIITTPGLPPAEARLEVELQHVHRNYPALRDLYLRGDPARGIPAAGTFDPATGELRSVTLNTDEWRALIPGRMAGAHPRLYGYELRVGSRGGGLG